MLTGALTQQRGKLLNSQARGIAGETAWMTDGFRIEELQLVLTLPVGVQS